MLTCEATGTFHPDFLPLSWEQMQDWHAFWLHRYQSDEAPLSDEEKIAMLKAEKEINGQ